MSIQLLPVAYTNSGHPAWADRRDLHAVGDEFATPGDALRRLKWLRDNGHHSVVPARAKLALLPYGGWR